MNVTTATLTDHTYHRLLTDVVAHGEPVFTRGMKTFELLGTQSIWPMRDPIVRIPGRKLGYRFMQAEAAWILSGDNRVATIAPFSKEVGSYSDDGVRFAGAYGPKVVDQLSYVVDTLTADPTSRRAVINIWRENPRPSLDYPCTLSLQFVVRHGALVCFSTMRSNDVWLGTPYDVFNFSMVAAAVRAELAARGQELALGYLQHRVASHHLYERHLDKALAVCNGPIELVPDDHRFDVLLDEVGKATSVAAIVDRLWAGANTTTVTT